VGRHRLAGKRRSSSLLVAAVIAPAALLLAAAADVRPLAPTPEPVPVAVAVSAPACCLEVVAVPDASTATASGMPSSMNLASGQWTSASRLRVAERNVRVPLAAGVAPEQGLQVRTILAARSISATFPEIHSIGGVRPDALRWHPEGLALDVMIPNPSSAEGIALGNQIVSYVLKNAKRFAIQDAIWRGTYYTPSGARASGAGHYDHVHVTTLGGGYPTGSEDYFR
jgi:hypothetical protein